MKTQVLKNSETLKPSNSAILVTMIILGGILIFAANNNQSLLKNGSISAELKPDFFYNGAIKNKVPESESSMAVLQSFLIPETEPELEVNVENSIAFPDVEPVVSTTDKALKSDDFIKDLQKQVSEKTGKVIALYALEKKIKESLSIETELPLQLEDWMLNTEYWCPELHETTALSEGK